jgi:subtilisin family serine protease
MAKAGLRGKRLLWVWAGILIVSWLCPQQSVSQTRSAWPQTLSALADAEAKSRADRISSVLLAVQDKMAAQLQALQPDQQVDYTALSNPLVKVDAGARLHVYIYVYQLGETEQAELRHHEVEIEIANDEFGIVQGWLPMPQLETVAALAFVRRVTAPTYGHLNRGTVTTEGDMVLMADVLRQIGFDGSGVRVGGISDGANNRAEAAANEDLPDDITVFGLCTPSAVTTCNEGTAMLEIIHDLAPGAELAIGTLQIDSSGTSLAFIDRVESLSRSFGADIMVDDIGFFQEPYFEDGPVARKVKQAVDDGVIYTSSAGNGAQDHYEADFIATTFRNMQVHDFGAAAGQASDATMDVLVDAGGLVAVTLQWSDAFGSSGNDYDIFILDEFGNISPGGNDTQNGDDDPLESTFWINRSNTIARVEIIVVQHRGESRRLEMLIRGDSRIAEYAVPAGSVFGHAAVSGVLAAAAANARTPDIIETFSAWGPAEIFHPTRETRSKPDVTSVDGVRVSGVGGFPTRFFGTSAAAPHVAGVAALLREAAPSATAAEIGDALTASAVDLGPDGPDFTFGAGRIDAVAALQELGNVPPNGEIDAPSGDVTITQGAAITFMATGTDLDRNLPLTFAWDFDGVSPASSLEAPGRVTFNDVGTFTVTLIVTDSLGLPDPTPATRRITVELPGDTRGGDGSGGGCTLSPGTSADGVLLAAWGAVIAFLSWRQLWSETSRQPLGAQEYFENAAPGRMGDGVARVAKPVHLRDERLNRKTLVG